MLVMIMIKITTAGSITSCSPSCTAKNSTLTVSEDPEGQHLLINKQIQVTKGKLLGDEPGKGEGGGGGGGGAERRVGMN